MVREKRDIRPVILKFGVALAISLGGILITFFRKRRIKPSNSSPKPSSGSEKGEFKNDDQTTPGSKNSVFDVPERYEDFSIPKSIVESSISGPSTSSRSYGDRDGFLLPEFNELVKEFGLPSKTKFSPRKDVETPRQDLESPKENKIVESYDREQEIKNLKNIVTTLKERERTLENQLLEYYGLKEQENAVMELQNRLKINNMETKLLGLKIESLKTDKMRLEAQVADHAKVVAELEAAKLKIKQLKKKLRLEAEHNREQILDLQERVLKLQDGEKNPVEAESDVQLKLQKLKDLESEAHELRKLNHSLRVENSTLTERLESVQIHTTSIMGDNEAEALKEESRRLREHNEDLMKEVEQLQADRCNDAEELVYLRWINACLRYELRNYQPLPGKTIARDLSKTLSPKSEEKAKQLILEYANKEGQEDMGINVTDIDSDWLSSQASYLTDSGEFDDTSIDNSSAHRTDASHKSKVFGKLMRLVRGKDHHHSHSSQDIVHCMEDNATRCLNYSSGYNSDTAVVDTGAVRLRSRSRTSSQGSFKQFIDFHPVSQDSRNVKGESNNYLTRMRRYSDVGSLDYISKHLSDSTQEKRNNHDSENAEKSELVKYAEVLKESRSKKSVQKRSKSISFF